MSFHLDRSLRSFIKAIGPRGTLLFFISLPFGFIQGFVEILFGFALVYFLAEYGLVSSTGIPPWVESIGLTPTVFLIVIGFVRWISTFISTLLTNLHHEHFCYETRRIVASSMLSSQSASRLSVAELSNIFANLMPKAATLLLSVSDAITRLAILGVMFVGLLRISANLTFVMLGLIAILVLPNLISRKLYQGYSMLIYADAKKFTERLSHSMRNLDFLRIIGKTTSETRELKSITEKIINSFMKYISWFTGSTTWPQFGAVGLIVFVVVINTRYSWISKAQLIAFIYILTRFTTGVGDATRAIGSIEFNYPFAKSLGEFFARLEPVGNEIKEEPIDISDLKPISKIDVHNLTVGRTGALLKNISFSVQKGDFIWISGQSGMGKTTLLLTLIGLLPPLEGKILWDGASPQANPHFLNKIAYSGADPFLLDGTIRDNLLMGNEAFHYSDEAIWNALKLCACDFVEQLPDKLNARLMEGGEGISAGQKQRLSIARALLRKPSILLLDEATANVDIETEKTIIQNIVTTSKDTIVFAVSHRKSLEQFASQKLQF